MSRFRFGLFVGFSLLFLWSFFQFGKKIKQRWIIEKTIKSPHWQKRNADLMHLSPGKYKVIFLGNSLTELFDFNEYFADTSLLNAGIVGDFSEGLTRRIETIARLQPEKLFIEIGINDMIEKIPLSTICKNYMRVIKTMQQKSPQTQLFIQSNLPVILKIPSFLASSEEVNQRVIEQNEHLKTLAKELKVTYIDIHTSFIRDQNLSELFVWDGIHLSERGYGIWKNILMPYLYSEKK